MEESYDVSLQIALIGDAGVGKTTTAEHFPKSTLPTTQFEGYTVRYKHIEVDGKRIQLQIRICSKVDSQFSLYNAVLSAGVMLVYDITNKLSFESIRNSATLGVLQDVCTAHGYMTILLGNKCDMSDMREVSRKQGEELADILGAKFMETSAKNSINVVEALEMMVKEIPKFNTPALQQLRQDAEDRSIRLWTRREQEEREAESYGITAALFNVVKSSTADFSDILIHGVEENYHIRVMVVGNGGVGKTTLTRRLLELPVNIKKYDSTNGIDVHIHCCDVDLESGIWSYKELKELSYGLLGRLKHQLLGKTQTHQREVKTTTTAEGRDFHLRCAKALQNHQNLVKTNSALSIKKDNLSSDEFHSDEQGSGDSTGIRKKHKYVESDTPPEKDQTPCEASSEPLHGSISTNDVQETLQRAKALTSEQNSRKAKVSFYDFAGQYVFHASHPTFLSSRAIYMLTFDLNGMLRRKHKSSTNVAVTERFFGDCSGADELNDLEAIFFWLHTIYMLSASKSNIYPHVVLVGTHADKLPKKDRDAVIAKFFRDFRSTVADSPLNGILAKAEYVVDNTKENNQVYSQLKTEIFHLAKLQPNWGEKTPTKWLPLDREIQCLKQSGRKVLTLKELKEINRRMDVHISNDSEIDAFLQFLHETGEIVFLCDKGLRDNIVLDPVWLIDAFKTIITAHTFALRTPRLAARWIDFNKSGIISHSTIVGIFEECVEDPSLFKNHEHVIRLMEKFLFVASPVGLTDDLEENSSTENETDVSYIMPCMVHKEADKQLVTHLEGLSSTSVFCMVTMNNFLPPAIFQKLLAMCITKWPIVEQHGQKLIFSGICKFNIDKTRHYKLVVFLVKYAIHARIVSFVDEEPTYFAVCRPVQEFLVRSLRSILQAMGFSDEFRVCIQCPQFSAIECGGYLDIDLMNNQDAITCDECHNSHLLKTKDLLGCWMEMGYGHIDSARATVDVGQVELAPQHELIEQKAPMTLEHINHARLCNALVTVCADGLRDILQSQVPPGYGNFHNLLLANKPTLTAMKQIRQEQINLLFPDPAGQATGTVDQFDITLLYALIRNMSTVAAPVTGWGKPPVDQPRDTSLGANVERIRIYRNKVNGHSVNGKLDDQTFEDYWDEIRKTMYDIEIIIGPKGYQAALKERKEQVFTSKEAQSLQRKLKEFQVEIKSVVESMSENMRKLQAMVEENY